MLSYFFFTFIRLANYSGEGGGPSQGLLAPRAIGCIRPQAFFRRFFSTGIPTSSYFPAASNRDRENGGWEARRLMGFFDWNTHFVVFFWRRRTGAGRPDLAGKFARMGAGRLGGLIQLV